MYRYSERFCWSLLRFLGCGCGNRKTSAQTAEESDGQEFPSTDAQHGTAMPNDAAQALQPCESTESGAAPVATQGEPTPTYDGNILLPALKPIDDMDIPIWLGRMIQYLRDVSDHPAWQNVVTDLVSFEKCGTANGVC